MFLSSLVSTLALSLPTSGAQWLTDYEQALAKAKESDKMVLVDFTGSDWCGWCIKLHDEVFDKPEFQAWAKEKVVLLELDYPRNKPQPKQLAKQNARLAKQFGIRGYPTILFLDSKGNQVARSGYIKGGPAAWIADADKKLKRAAAASKSQGTWLTSYDLAMKKARESGKPVLVDFTGSDWCGWCIKLHDEVFGKSEFHKWAEKNVVLLELDYPRRKPQDAALRKQNAELAKKYSIRAYPTILFLDATGEVMGKSGYIAGGPQAWIGDAQKKLKKTR